MNRSKTRPFTVLAAAGALISVLWSCGIGLATALLLARKGHTVYAAVRNPASATELRDTIAAERLPARIVRLDLDDEASIRAAVQQIADAEQRIDVLVNNAGIGGPVLDFEEAAQAESVFAMSDEAWDTQLVSNLRTAFASSAAVSPHLERGGSIVNIPSIATLGPTPQLPAYGAAKAGVVHLTRTLAIELAPRRIRVHCICPGLLWTRAWEMLAARMKGRRPEFANMTERQVFEAIVAQQTPLGGEQTPEDIGNLAVFY